MKFCIIPARGGSKRIPRKNIRAFCGRPIIVYSIEAAQTTGLFDRIMVSTEDEEVAELACKLGVEIPFLRPAALADDYVSANAVVKHAIQWYQARGVPVTEVCCLYATAPFVNAQHLREGWERLRNSGKSFVFSVTPYPFPIQRAIRLNAQGEVAALYPEYRNTRSQDLETTYHDAGQFYWGTAQAFLDDLPLFSQHALGLVLPPYLVQDIDTEDDWRRAELMFRAWQQGEAACK